MHKKTILELHEDLKNNKITCNELFNSSAAHIKRVNPMLNAITSFVVQKEQYNSDSLLANIPYACKDLIATKGLVTANASAFLEDFTPVYDATIYSLLKESNAQLVAKTNMDEFGMGGLNINTVVGPSNNPYDLNTSTGGSSGGSAALVAAGCVPYAIGTDTGDSVRRPAAFCGIYGFKPTWGTISRYGAFPYASSLDQVGIFTRSISDLALVFETINGFDKRDSSTYNHPKELYYQNLDANKKNSIAYIKELNETFNNEVVKSNFSQTIDYLISLGHTVQEVSVSSELIKLISPTYQVISNVEASSNLGDITGVVFGKRAISDQVNSSMINSRSAGLSKYTKVRLALGAIAIKEENKDRYYYKAKQVRQLMIDAISKIFNTYDLIIAPSTNGAAVKKGYSVSDPMALENLVASNHLALANLVGVPSLHIPTHLNDGMPYGISIMARPFADQMILDFAKGFENGLLNENYKDLISFYNRYVEEVK